MTAFTPRPDLVRELVDRGLLAHTGKTNLVDAWRSVVKTNDVVGLKVVSGPGHTSGTRPAVVEAVVAGLLAAGVPALAAALLGGMTSFTITTAAGLGIGMAQAALLHFATVSSSIPSWLPRAGIPAALPFLAILVAPALEKLGLNKMAEIGRASCRERV